MRVRRDGRRTLLLAGLLACGIAVRIALVVTTSGQSYDLESMSRVAEALRGGDLGHFYSRVNAGPGASGFPRWPYPPGFLPLVRLSAVVAREAGLAFADVVRLPASVADVLLAAVVGCHLHREGRPHGAVVASVAAIVFSPVLLAVSAHHGQIDAIAILPAVAAVAFWRWRGGGKRAVAVGALIGLGASLKTVPILLLIALLPTAVSVAEAVVLTMSAVGVLGATLLPFAMADHAALREALGYRGAPGLGSLSLVVQPGLPLAWFGGRPSELSPASRALVDVSPAILGFALLAVFAIGLRRRWRPEWAAVVLWVAVLTFGSNFFMQYLVWLLPFVLLAGHVRVAVALQVAMVPPLLITYVARAPSGPEVWVLYTVPMLAAWAVGAWLLLAAFRRGDDLRPARDVDGRSLASPA